MSCRVCGHLCMWILKQAQIELRIFFTNSDMNECRQQQQTTLPLGSRYFISKVHPCTGRTAHRRSRGIPLPILEHGTRKGWGVSVTPRPLFTPGKDPVPIVQEVGWAPRAGLDRCEKSRPPPGFEPRTVQPVASRYTDSATRHTRYFIRSQYKSVCVRSIVVNVE